MAVKVLTLGDIVIVAPRGRFIGGNETEELESTLSSLADQDNKKLIIDFANVEVMTSRVLGVLATAFVDYQRRGGTIKICNVDRNIKSPLVITRLIELFAVYLSVEEARLSFSSDRGAQVQPSQ